ncbi:MULTISPECIES: bifunctional DNA primase/polymerase [unclassified Microcoleus]|uniref:bifunctional DNA primase/polymerase n=1 Tax=unclassified Microcoleus TaxID=2642155 RepID=UPI001D2224C5|nr:MULTISPECIES: bifunctional DNA primase/polymerase [unclassified Microcoleus]MCC3473300.1 bifunctional DNA primase/polymerase [Microcoleus sp. PH2017_13_LAR_U_A]MCC3486533.1 bifunctional DNA primase/polymerase [Microcoleus sp. PH2017_14_LAR_D_A]MCC3600170.1 bifunctional DNA primase/polymerase [Microcoleus sp. PH2017_26_ELK_O_A]MCC3623176.1 bifunctional DNA primase/polymerase [Microcoleus sp. PH2017_36_ELK_O_B]
MQTLPALLEIPENWSLVPVRGKKPYQKGWNSKQYDRLEILAELESGKATGLGLKLGNGLLAVDIDGESAAKLLVKLAGENSLTDFPRTTAWTSGRQSRKQCLFSVPEKDWCRLRNLRIGTGIAGDDGKEECLEFRWLGTQSVLPPSVHPTTNKPYIWLKNPLQHPPLPAPEWLIELCENWHSEYVSDKELDLVRFPARLFPHFGRKLSVWLLARRFDISRWSHGGKSKGSGIGKFSLAAASKILDRSQGHIRKLLCAAKRSGLIRDYSQSGKWVTVCYASLEKAIALTGIEKLGPIAAINIDDLANIHILATEVEAQNLQRASLHRQRLEEVEQIKAQGLDPEHTPTQIIKPIDLHTCDYPARVLGKGDRFIYCNSDFRFYGGSQEAIADSRGISQSTVSRHLSNRYRLVATPVRGYRQELPPIVKKQLVEKLPHLKKMPSGLCMEDGLFSMHGDWWKPHCNVYLLDHRLVSARRRRLRVQGQIDKESLLFEKISQDVSNNNDSLYVVLFEELKELIESLLIRNRNLPATIKTGTRKSKNDHSSTINKKSDKIRLLTVNRRRVQPWRKSSPNLS